ncbi:MAG: hypothetical protein IT303_16035 [Dehalococcoidia bacterium]|nr:hypothetical protein [Dehalococcoidia bacterium]
MEPGFEAPSPGATDSPTEADFAALAAAIDERDADLETERETNRQLLDRLRTALLASDPLVEPELVRGISVGDLETSFAAAQAAVQRVRQAVLRDVSVPAGSPARTTARPSSPLEKIRAGLGV